MEQGAAHAQNPPVTPPFDELWNVEGLTRIDRRFLTRLCDTDADLGQRLLGYRNGDSLSPLDVSALLMAVAPHLEAFIGELFGIQPELARGTAATRSHDVVVEFKKQFVLKRAKRFRGVIDASFAQLDEWLDGELTRHGMDGPDRELGVARVAEQLLRDNDADGAGIEMLTRWCVQATKTEQGRRATEGWMSFTLPRHTDFARLVPLNTVEGDAVGRMAVDVDRLRQRDGFKLTDVRMPARAVQGQIHYCVYCHENDGDFCSKGFPNKKGEPERGLAVNPLGETLTGCPLEEKISEMHALKREGRMIAALAMVMVDNPMVPATGHRICNDCMKACIYQKQDPVDIPQIETRVLTDVLDLPWGVEIYGLLTVWNPLRSRQYLPKPCNGRKVLIAGLGPAGFTMAHHLTMEGCAVVGIDGLKIEPLPEALLTKPLRNYADLVEPLDSRVMAGFGGVAEYGITVRWDKSFLKLIYLTLARRATLQMFGGVRLGGTVTLEDAWRMGFDHVCIATGAGLPKVIPMGNSLARGMRQASDFLMALQLTGAAQAHSLACLEVRLPALVIGGGLTAIDTATEVQAYYIAQVEKTLRRYEELTAAHGDAYIRDQLDEEARAISHQFLEHGRAVRAERERAAAAGQRPDFITLLRRWGGVTVIYRRGINESPAYLRNHEEIRKAVEEGIYYAEGLEPLRAELDGFGHICSLVCRHRVKEGSGRWLSARDEVTLAARAVFVAAGATPNIIYEIEHPGTFVLDGDHFLPHVAHREGLQPANAAQHCKESDFGPLTSYREGRRRVSFIGDTHPVFHGSVVKAIASAMRSYPAVMAELDLLPKPDSTELGYRAFRERIAEALAPSVVKVRRESGGVLELTVRAPLAARNFAAGQFFRLQNFESSAPCPRGTPMQTGPLTLSGAGIVNGNSVRMIVLEGSAGSRLCAALRPGDPVVLMGPTGAPTEIVPGETVLVAGGKWAAAAMLSLGPAQRAAGNRVLFLAAFQSAGEVYFQNEIEAAVDQVLWCSGGEPRIVARRPQDRSVTGNPLEALIRYAEGGLQDTNPGATIKLHEVDRILVFGSTALLRAFQDGLKGDLKRCFKNDVQAIGGVGSPMQCMLKGVCAQCLQWQIDPDTGHRTRAVFSCATQDQPLAWIDVDNLAARVKQNALTERLTNLWLDHLLARNPIERV
ncbi:MAG: FAD-dependent oxidoreductase [Burkholderiales bacterium]